MITLSAPWPWLSARLQPPRPPSGCCPRPKALRADCQSCARVGSPRRRLARSGRRGQLCGELANEAEPDDRQRRTRPRPPRRGRRAPRSRRGRRRRPSDPPAPRGAEAQRRGDRDLLRMQAALAPMQPTRSPTDRPSTPAPTPRRLRRSSSPVSEGRRAGRARRRASDARLAPRLLDHLAGLVGPVARLAEQVSPAVVEIACSVPGEISDQGCGRAPRPDPGSARGPRSSRPLPERRSWTSCCTRATYINRPEQGVTSVGPSAP